MVLAISTVSDLIEYAMNRVVSAVAGVLLNGSAVLLPDVHDWCCSLAV